MFTEKEKEFIISLFNQTRIGVNESNAVEICLLVRSITEKLKGDI